MSCTLEKRFRVRLTAPSLTVSAEWTLLASYPAKESSEPVLDIDDVLEREEDANENMVSRQRTKVAGAKRARTGDASGIYAGNTELINCTHRVHNASASFT